MTELDDILDLPDHALLAGEFGLVRMGVERNFIAHRPAEQLVDRLAEDLAPDIPKGDIDGAHALDGSAGSI